MGGRRQNDPFPYPNEIYPGEWFQRLETDEIFGNENPIEIDLGCGDGGFLLAMATEHPDRNFLGIERLLGRVRKIWKRTESAGLENVKVVRIDSNYAVEWLLPKEFASRIHFLCPDPWPKKKHARRRQMCQIPFLKKLHDLLIPGGELLFKTDHPPYYEESCEVVDSPECGEFFERLDWPEDAFFYPQTDFEKQWLAEGKSMQGIRLKRKTESDLA